MDKDMNRHFTKRDIQMAMKVGYSTLFFMRRKENKTII